MATETMKITGSIKIQNAEKIFALECDVTRKWTRTPQDTGLVTTSGNL